MLEHRTFIQSLSREQRQSLTQRNSFYAAGRLIVLVACILLCSTAIVQRIPLLPLWFMLQGLLLISLFHLMHECIHDTVFESRWPNRTLAHICGFVLFLPAIWFRYFHHAHHRYTQQADKDPELSSEKPTSVLQWLIHISGFMIWRSAFLLLVRAVYQPVREPFLNKKNQTTARAEMLLMLVAYALLFVLSLSFSSTILLSVWIIPLLLGQPFLRLYLLAEHTGCHSGTNMFANTRTVLTNPIVRWFTWNMPYHTEHHVFPSVPFHQLPRLHGLMQSYLIEVDAGYIDFNTRYVKKIANS